jgi:hypothetical protein
MLFLPPVVGAVLGSAVMVGVVWSQSQPPETNPATQQVLTYGS